MTRLQQLQALSDQLQQNIAGLQAKINDRSTLLSYVNTLIAAEQQGGNGLAAQVDALIAQIVAAPPPAKAPGAP